MSDDADVQELLRNNFEDFFIHAFHYTHPETELSFDPYIQYICHRYQTLKKGARVVINQPPRTLKSWTAKFFAAWHLGKHPGAEIMIIANTQRLAERITYDIRGILQAKWYKRLFPKMRIARDRAAVNHLKTRKGGGIFAGSVEMSLAGFGADLLILDDPDRIKHASRPDKLGAVNTKFDGEIYSRLNNRKKGIVIVVQHRLSDQDLSGHLIRQGYKCIAIPLIATQSKAYPLPDDRLWHRKKGDILLGHSLSKKDLEKAKRSTEPDFHWYYQQGVGRSLIPFKPENFTITANPLATGPTVISIDAAQRSRASSSFNVIQVWKLAQDSYHLFHQFRQQCTFTDLESKATAFIKRERPAVVLIEHAANGSALLARLRDKFKKVDIRAVEPRESKTVRLNRHRAAIQRGKISLQEAEDWLTGYIDEFINFPDGGTDQVDATTQFLDFMSSKPILKRPEPRAISAGFHANGAPINAQSRATWNTPHSSMILGSRFRKKPNEP